MTTRSAQRAADGRAEPAAPDRCPLCAYADYTQIDSFRYEEIWDRLHRDWGARFSWDVVAENTPTSRTCLVGCNECGLRFFAPLHPGTERFYQQLMRAIPYVSNRWEFDRVAAKISAGQSVLDLGCGDGLFLEKVESRAGRVVGVDLNPDVGSRWTGSRIEIHSMRFQAFAEAEPGAFDVVCAFHVAEHMPDVSALLDPAAACLRPSGRLFISVPNARRRGAKRLEPLDCPPHHVSRWRLEQLHRLGVEFGLHLHNVYFEPPFFGPPSSAARQSGERSGVRRRAVALLRDHVYARRLGRRPFESMWYGRWGVVGHGMLGEFGLAPRAGNSRVPS
jgi:SAM-dependent methyltransferase